MDKQARKEEIRTLLEATRRVTCQLMENVPDAILNVRVHDFYSPIGWHFGHIGMTEEYWTAEEAMGQPCRDARLRFLFANLPENPKNNRVHLPPRSAIEEYLAETRRVTLNALEHADLSSDNPLLSDGYAWEFARQHECQHQETIAELLQLISRQEVQQRLQDSPASLIGFHAPTEFRFRNHKSVDEAVAIPGGTFLMGSDDPHGYDNEQQAHEVTVAPFQMDKYPVTAFQWSLFMQEGGYQRPELWSGEGWAWRETGNVTCPEFWMLGDGNGYSVYGMNGVRPLHPDEPVCGISWFEADAYARWKGKRLPTEAEWEFAARFDPATGRTRWFPWSEEQPTAERAVFGLNQIHPQAVGSCPVGASAFGLQDMAGNVWEWTCSSFLPYPGFRAFPYDGYSLDHMDGKHFVCRGGSWASAATILRASFRNWYVPSYRQGLLGMRCAI